PQTGWIGANAMDSTSTAPAASNGGASQTDSPDSLASQLTMIERTASAAHHAIDNFAKKAESTLRRVRHMASDASSRFNQGCKSYSTWEDECVENSRERIRGRPLT